MQHALALPPQEALSAPSLINYTIPAQWNGLVLVGEAPGADEVRLGRPFVGRSGQLLDKILEKAEIARDKCLIANVFRYRPPANKVDHFFTSRRAAAVQNINIAEQFGKFGSAFCRADFAGEIEHLGEMLTARNPKIIVALGRTPMWALTGKNGLMEKVGQLLPSRLSPKHIVIPTFHPSFILRGNWKLQDQWLSHFALAKQYLK